MRGKWTPPAGAPEAPVESPFNCAILPVKCSHVACTLPVMGLRVWKDHTKNVPWECPNGHRNEAMQWPTNAELRERMGRLVRGEL